MAISLGIYPTFSDKPKYAYFASSTTSIVSSLSRSCRSTFQGIPGQESPVPREMSNGFIGKPAFWEGKNEDDEDDEDDEDGDEG